MSVYVWQKSSFSGQAVNCLHIAGAADGTLRLRESDWPKAVLRSTRATMRGLLVAIKTGIPLS
ncbi:DUF397 domain-containing protein [Streptomyces sp. AV19]|uniref:DUF397 domain-containing protein n=1 Tax=Streptomyces sp. AV19 TaxID=2793068 RepID=UPI0018FEF437|nr:DUF397 domain-containing protein [Streptomyces sp. AV19]MBH1934083.1 DUF397 domain-containing protein [Streptomyces sp. AV19]MDG4535436.1 DUF397 domain-containing protein [Streptomyces sp. AV19]